MSKDTLGTKQICPDCGAKFYDLNALDVVCPKCDYAFAAADLADGDEVIAANDVASQAKEVALSSPPKSSKKITIEEETDDAPIKSVAMLEADEDYPDVDHFEEVEEHFEASEVDVNSDDADDEMFMEELDHGEAALLSEFEHVDPDGYRGDGAMA